MVYQLKKVLKKILNERIDVSNRKALEGFQRNLNSHIFSHNVHGL